MPIEFDITLTSRDMYRFNMYQTYTSFQGWFSIAVSIVIFAVAGVTYGTLDMTYTLLYILFGVIFLVYVPVSLLMRSKHAFASSEVLRKPLHYSVNEDGFTVSQGEESARLPWEQIYKVSSTKSNVLVYSNRTNAYIIPKEQLGDRYRELARLSGEKLPGYRAKMK